MHVCFAAAEGKAGRLGPWRPWQRSGFGREWRETLERIGIILKLRSSCCRLLQASRALSSGWHGRLSSLGALFSGSCRCKARRYGLRPRPHAFCTLACAHTVCWRGPWQGQGSLCAQAQPRGRYMGEGFLGVQAMQRWWRRKGLMLCCMRLPCRLVKFGCATALPRLCDSAACMLLVYSWWLLKGSLNRYARDGITRCALDAPGITAAVLLAGG